MAAFHFIYIESIFLGSQNVYLRNNPSPFRKQAHIFGEGIVFGLDPLIEALEVNVMLYPFNHL